MELRIEKSWKSALKESFLQQYFSDLRDFVNKEYKSSEGVIFPASKDIFKAFDLCPFDRVKVVILGQDPYHGQGQANGLSFAVGSGIKIPPSLRNIFKEIEKDMGYRPFDDGDLSRWAKQGVLLLNAVLTVRDGSPGSHQGIGWEQFTDSVIKKLSDDRENLVFILWGNYAKAKGSVIDRNKHLVLESPHPSPFSAFAGFFDCKHFSKANEYLKKNIGIEIDWR